MLRRPFLRTLRFTRPLTTTTTTPPPPAPSSSSSEPTSSSSNDNNTNKPTNLTSNLNLNSTSCSAHGFGVVPRHRASLNRVTLVGVAHDIQTGYVFEDAVTQFTLTTTSLDTTNHNYNTVNNNNVKNNLNGNCVVEKDHHTVRCFGDRFSQEVRAQIHEGAVLCVSGRLRLNPQLEPSSQKYFYFPFIHVQPPEGQLSVIYADRRAPPMPREAPSRFTDASPEESAGNGTGGGNGSGTTE